MHPFGESCGETLRGSQCCYCLISVSLKRGCACAGSCAGLCAGLCCALARALARALACALARALACVLVVGLFCAILARLDCAIALLRFDIRKFSWCQSCEAQSAFDLRCWSVSHFRFFQLLPLCA